jgi:Arc/MetJ family transcription regulator
MLPDSASTGHRRTGKNHVGADALICPAKRSPAIFVEMQNQSSCLEFLFLHNTMCNNSHMATNLALDDRLIEEARRIGRHKTKREAVSAALAEYVKRRKQLRILDAFGTVEFDPKYDYKAERRRKR